MNPGATLTLQPSSTRWASISGVQWFKNGNPIAGGAESALVLANVDLNDTGSYRATLTGDGEQTGTVFAHVLVQSDINHPLTNISTRGTIGPTNPQVIVGFSIPQKIDSEHRPKRLLVRAVGDTLQDFGVTNPLPDPEVHIFDSQGNDVEIVILGIAGGPPKSTFTLGRSAVAYNVVAPEPAPANIITSCTTVILNLADGFGPVSNITWHRGETVVASANEFLEIEGFSASDSGDYWASFAGNTEYPNTDRLSLRSGVADRHRLLNQSSRIKISPESPQATFGFVIASPLGGSFRGQSTLIRVIGPGLANHGVQNPLPDPIYRLRDATGRDLTPGQAFTAIFINGKTSQEYYRDEVNEASTSVGAFPVESALQYDTAPRNLADIAQLTGVPTP